MVNEARVERGRRVELTAEAVEGSAERFTLGPASVFVGLRPGDQIRVHSGGPLLQVENTGDGRAQTSVLESGLVRSNKVVSIDPRPHLAPLSDADVAAIEVGAAAGIRHYALSFASCAGDVELLRALVPEGATVISKVESRVGVRHRDEIIDLSDAVIVDRGDLSREVPVEYVPFYQKAIVRQANRWNRPVYVATNILETMVTSRNPSIAEMNDIANTLLDGVHGLVLAAETAIGIDPVGSVDMVQRCISAVEHSTSGSLLEEDRMLSGADVARVAS
jgi:pyruvate kinase